MLVITKNGNPARHLRQYKPYIPRPVREARLVEYLGSEESYIGICKSSEQLAFPVPVMGTQLFAVDGMVIPAIEGAAFTSLSDIIAEATAGKQQELWFNKVGVVGTAAISSTLWYEGLLPSAGAAPGTLASGGTNYTRSTAGAIGPQVNADGGDTLHLLSGFASATVAGNTLMLIDRIWGGLIDRTTTSAQSITMTPTRYETTGSTGTSKNNQAFVEVSTVLANTAHSYTSFTYVDDSGNTTETAAAITGRAAAVVKTFDHSGIFIPINTGDRGISDITSITLSATLASGAMSLILCHPLAIMPCNVANQGQFFDYINGMFNMIRIYDDACLSFIESYKPSTTATSYFGKFVLVSG